MHHFVAVLDHGALDADLHHGQFAHLRDALQGVQRLRLAGEGLGFVLVGENDVDIVPDEVTQEFEVFGHDVETGQVDGDLQSALLGRAGSLADQVVVLDDVTFDIEAVVPVEDRRVDLRGGQFECRAEVGDHRPLAVGRDERHALARTFRATEDYGFHAQVFECLDEEVARRILSDLADEPDLAAQFGHGADGVACRTAERERVGQSCHGFRDFGLQFGIHEAHRAFGEFEATQHGV